MILNVFCMYGCTSIPMYRKSNRLGTILLLFSIFQEKTNFHPRKLSRIFMLKIRMFMEHIVYDVSYSNKPYNILAFERPLCFQNVC